MSEQHQSQPACAPTFTDPNLPDLSIVIVSWNTRELLAQCLQSVAAEQSAHPQLRLETFVVDNASHDGSGALVRTQFPWVHLQENEDNVGFAAANNQAIGLCRGHYVLLLNPDTQIIPGALQALVHFMVANPRAGAAGARLLNPDGTLQLSCHPRPTLAREGWRLFHLDRLYAYAVYNMQAWWITQARCVDVVQGAAMIIRRDVLTQVGGLDAGYFIYSEEVDLCARIQRAGWHIYWAPQSAVVHYGGQSTQQVAAEMFLRLYEGKVNYFRKNRGQFAATVYKLILLVAATLRLLLSPLAWLAHRERRTHHLTLAGHYRRLIFALPGL